MDESALHYHHLLQKINHSKNDFLDWFEHLIQIEGKYKDLYEIINSWSDEKVLGFVNWFDWNLDKIRFRIWKWDRISEYT
jgi:hypothetical protein